MTDTVTDGDKIAAAILTALLMPDCTGMDKEKKFTIFENSFHDALYTVHFLSKKMQDQFG